MATKTRLEPIEKPFQTKVKVDSAGRIVIPAEFRKALGVEPGKTLMIRVTEPGFMEVWTTEYAVRKSQEMMRKYVPEGVSLVDELIEERRYEAYLEGLPDEEATRLRAERFRRLEEERKRE